MQPRIQVNVPYTMLLENLDLIIEKKINPEIYFNGDELDNYQLKDAMHLENVLKLHQVHTTIHGPFMDLSPGGTDAKVKRATVERIVQTMEVASVFKPPLVVFHPGYNKWFFDNKVNLWLQHSITTWRPILAMAEAIGTVIVLENIFEEDPSILERLIVTLNSPYLGFCFDTGHFNLFSTVPMEEWFKKLGRHMRSFHLHDNCKTADDHLPIGEGNIDFALFFHLIRKYKVDAIYTVEPHRVEDVEKSLEACKRYLMDGG